MRRVITSSSRGICFICGDVIQRAWKIARHGLTSSG